MHRTCLKHSHSQQFTNNKHLPIKNIPKKSFCTKKCRVYERIARACVLVVVLQCFRSCALVASRAVVTHALRSRTNKWATYFWKPTSREENPVQMPVCLRSRARCTRTRTPANAFMFITLVCSQSRMLPDFKMSGLKSRLTSKLLHSFTRFRSIVPRPLRVLVNLLSPLQTASRASHFV